MGENLNLIESVSEGFPSYFCSSSLDVLNCYFIFYRVETISALHTLSAVSVTISVIPHVCFILV